jgi:hypothetical protein
MQKGFGFYSPHETTVFFLKAAFVSTWIGLDLLAALAVIGLPPNVVARHSLLLLVVSAILAAGTVFSILLAWATGSLFARTGNPVHRGFLHAFLHRLKDKPYQLIGAGAACVPAVMVVSIFMVFGHAPSRGAERSIGRANLAVAEKCTEVAARESELFRSDERIVMTQCMLQYDKTYAALRAD